MSDDAFDAFVQGIIALEEGDLDRAEDATLAARSRIRRRRQQQRTQS